MNDQDDDEKLAAAGSLPDPLRQIRCEFTDKAKNLKPLRLLYEAKMQGRSSILLPWRMLSVVIVARTGTDHCERPLDNASNQPVTR
jgi:hypothetical protein